jgi:hypothetical protein
VHLAVAPAPLDSLVSGRARLDLRADRADLPLELVASLGLKTGWMPLGKASPTAFTGETPLEDRFVALDTLMTVLKPAILAGRVGPAVSVAARVAALLPANPAVVAAVRDAVSSPAAVSDHGVTV